MLKLSFKEHLEQLVDLYDKGEFKRVITILTEHQKHRDLSFGERQYFRWSQNPGIREKEVREQADRALLEIARIKRTEIDSKRPKLTLVRCDL